MLIKKFLAFQRLIVTRAIGTSNQLLSIAAKSQKMALRAVYVVISFCKSSYEVKSSQCHLLATIENNRLEGPIGQLWSKLD